MIKDTQIGVLGGGQLGQMLALEARRMGIRVSALDPDPTAPGGRAADRQIVGSFRDPAMIRVLADGCQVLTVEIEHVDTETLKVLESEGVAVHPSPRAIEIIQDKYLQKTHLAGQHLPLAPFFDTPNLESIQRAGRSFGYPLMLKTRRFAYDGRGNAVVRSESDIPAAFEQLGRNDLYAEGWVAFKKELAVMVARSRGGQTVAYPVVQTIHRDSILHAVIAPAQLPEGIAAHAQEIARKAIASLDGAGVFGVELFLNEHNEVLINEIAPRPHNSGHYTLEACYTNQFEQHLRAICGLPLGDPGMRVGAAVMINVLGEDDPKAAAGRMEAALNIQGAAIHWYGKKESRPQRKMGHITLTGTDLGTLTGAVAAVAEVPLDPAPLVGIIMGSDSDLRVMRAAAEMLRRFEIPFELTIVSAHRTPDRMVEYARAAHLRGLRVIIAGAGGAAHLPGMVAALTPLPVIGVPINATALQGQDALLSIVQMPRGVPVATVAIDNAANAGLLAVRILGTERPALYQKMLHYQAELESEVLAKAAALEQKGGEGGA
ncbi:MAG: 5-(carboxyamino)imidazole ribonucleotide synthase [Anaerolinea sp.]|nr:5-(carboxyamino)imidazole ribonucleotide synthase [Anaerolinea sp.]